MIKKSKYGVSLLFLLVIFGFAALFFVLPKGTYSQNEKRVLEDTPKLTFSTLTGGQFSSDLDSYITDHFPLREFFVGVNAYAELYTGRNGASGVYKGSEGYLIAVPEPFDAEQTTLNVERFQDFAELTGLPASLMIVPTAGYTMEEKLPRNHLTYHDDAVFEIAAAGGLPLVDLRTAFSEAKNEEQLYYKTDHHLTSAGAYLMYQCFCAEQGLEAKEFKVSETHGGFYGTAYSRSGLWLEKPDTLTVMKPEDPAQVSVTIDDGRGEQVYDSLYFPEHLSEMDQYPVFLNGNHSLVTVENKDCRNGKRLLLVKDSFAHCFATFLIENYEEICMVDLRYFRGDVSVLAEEKGLNEILYLYGAENLASSKDTAWLMPLTPVS